MKITTCYRFFFLTTMCLIPAGCLFSQCTNHVLHLNGTHKVGCTDVTVTSTGIVGSGNSCMSGPYWVGCNGIPGQCASFGAYTFVFSPPVSSAVLSFTAINNNTSLGFGEEEVSLEVNGVFYTPTPGVFNCGVLAIITGNGTIGAPLNTSGGGWKDMVIPGPIDSLKVSDHPIAGLPGGALFSLDICSVCCPTYAGMLTSPPIAKCQGASITVPPATQTVLDMDDILGYILFSDPNDTLGSIVATSSTPTFSFDPATMQTDVTYYIAAIAGNNLNGTVDLSDPCLSISNAILVSWRPLPLVSFTIPDPTFCKGSCATITATFTGTPPFQLQYQSGNSGIVTQNFADYMGEFQVCPPPGTPAGALTVSAIRVTDAFCTCQ